jgi:hypothetical protein
LTVDVLLGTVTQTIWSRIRRLDCKSEQVGLGVAIGEAVSSFGIAAF